MPRADWRLLLCALLVFHTSAVHAASRLKTGNGSPSERYGFRWDRDWTWNQLTDHVRSVEPKSLQSIESIRSSTSLSLARILFRNLAALSEPAESLRVPERSAIDRPGARTKLVQDTLAAALKDESPHDDLAGMISTAERFAQTRKRLADWFLPDLQGRTYKPSVSRDKRNPGIRVQLDFHVAEAMLDKLSRPDTPDSEWARLAEETVIKRLLLHRGLSRLRQAALIEWWRRASDASPLNRLYEWVYPGSYYDFGGVSVNAEGYRDLIRKLRAGKSSFEDSVIVRLSRYLPEDQPLTARVDFLFAADADGWATGYGIGIDIEHFGDDFEYLTSIVAHECFHLAQTATVIPVTTLAPEGPDRLLHDDLLMPVWREGIASYVGPPWKGGPAGDPEPHFRYFEETFAALKQGDIGRFKKLIREGLNLAGPLYKLGWLMAKRIEDARGRSSLVEIQTLGPATFFERYVQSYKTPRLPLPAGPQFTAEVEQAIGRVTKGIDRVSLLASARIARMADPDRIKSEAGRFEEAFAANPNSGLAHVHLGDVIERKTRDHELAQRLMVAGLKLLGPDSGELVRREGYLLLQAGAARQAIEVFEAGVGLAPTDPDRLYMLGEGFRIAGQTTEARSAYRRALALNAQFEPARHGLALLE